jgi:hypothetical protein
MKFKKKNLTTTPTALTAEQRLCRLLSTQARPSPSLLHCDLPCSETLHAQTSTEQKQPANDGFNRLLLSNLELLGQCFTRTRSPSHAGTQNSMSCQCFTRTGCPSQLTQTHKIAWSLKNVALIPL